MTPDTPKLLICNADDFGLGRRVTDAIVDAHTGGIVTSTTLMTNMPAAEYAVERSREVPELGVGVHLTLTQGRPLSPLEEVPNLVDDEGNFLPILRQRENLWRGAEAGAQVAREFEAQIRRALDLGLTPTHCDSHHGIHKMPVALVAFLRLLPKYDIPAARTHRGGYFCRPDAPLGVRMRRTIRNLKTFHRIAMRRWIHGKYARHGLRTPDRLANVTMLVSDSDNPKKRLLDTLAALRPGVSEMAFHPGYDDPEVHDPESFAGVRESDMRILTDPDVVEAVSRHGIRPISFGDLA